MSEILVPVDLTQEEKEILAVFSKRQFALVFPSVVVSLIFLLWGNVPFIPNGLPDIIVRLLLFLIVSGSSVALAYVWLDKHQQYLSEFVVTQWRFRKSQKVYYQ